MSDLEKELQEIPLPKPKKKVKTKAKQSAKQALARTRKKVAKAEQSLRSAKAHAKNVKDKLLTIDKVLDGKEQQLITQGRNRRSSRKYTGTSICTEYNL